MPESPQHTRRMAPSLRLGTAAAVSLGLCQWTVLPLEVSDYKQPKYSCKDSIDSLSDRISVCKFSIRYDSY